MRSSFLRRKCITSLLAGIALAVPALQAEAESSLVTEGSEAASLDACVAPTQEIRRYHMKYLKHDRDEVVIEGDRRVKYSLAACVNCHAGTDDAGSYQPVNAEGQFCDACHDSLAVSPDCFQCHRTTPDPKSKKLSSSALDRLHDQMLDASTHLDSIESQGLYANEPAGIQRD
ncbi:MAG: sulfur reduction protein DsrJ [Chromatiales bacterium]|jgi:hypothetical protein